MSYTFRRYTRDDSLFTRLTPIPAGVREIQVALAFARDYDGNNNPTNGIFQPYWDTYRVTPAVITQLKEENPPNRVKVLVSIGDRSGQYPFTVEAGDRASWVANATKSLTRIIKDYNLDGIDVYYEQIKSRPQDFVYCIGNLMENLNKNGAISVASIAPTAPLNANFYLPLHEQYSNYIDTVVYQCFTEPEPVNSPQALVEIFNAIANQYSRKKLLAGYSTVNNDWATVPPVLYFIAVFPLQSSGTVEGTALWDVSDTRAPGVTTSGSFVPFAPQNEGSQASQP